jgi:TolB-like protein
VCYSHEDKDVVYSEIAWLQQQGVNIWYDDGISAGQVWRAEIGDAIEKCTSILFYVSRSSLASAHCSREINLGLDEEKAILPIYLEKVNLTSDLRVGLSRVQALHRSHDKDYQRRLLEALDLGAPLPQEVDVPSGKASKRLATYTATFCLLFILGGTGWWYFQSQGIEGPERGAVANAEKPTIAVLPFNNLSPDIEQEYFSDGVAEDILNGLAHNSDVIVRARNSSFAFKGQLVDTRTIAERLNVTYIVNGSVRTVGNRVRVNVRLTAVEEDVEVWSDSYDADLEDVFAVQDRIAGAVLGALDLQFFDTERQHVSADAYDEFLRGRYHSARFEIPEAISAFEKAIQIEPNYAEALSGLGSIYGILDTMATYSEIGLRDQFREKQRVYYDRALNARPEALVPPPRDAPLQQRLDEVSRLTRQHPNDLNLAVYRANLFRVIGRSDLELRVLDHHVSLDPLNSVIYRLRGDAKLFAGLVEEAIDDFEASEGFGHIPSPYYPALVAFFQRDSDRLEELVESNPTWTNVEHFKTIMAAAVHYLRGNEAGIDETLAPLEVQSDEVSSLVKFWIALIRGQNDSALRHYRDALKDDDFVAYQIVRGYPGMWSLFPEYFAQPGYEAMLREFEFDSASVAELVIPDLPY